MNKHGLTKLIIIISLIWGALVLLIRIIDKDNKFEGVDSLFSGLALAAIIYTIFLQKRELRLQRKELKLTRKELKHTREEFVTQNETLKLQRFENTFFQMLALHHEIVDKLVYKYVSKPQTIRALAKQLENKEEDVTVTAEKREVFEVAKDVLMKSVGRYSVPKSKATISEAYTELQKAYNDFFENKFENVLSHYFRNLFHIFKYIYLSDLSKEDKRFYSSLVRAQISPDELLLIFYNAVMPGLGNPKFLFLVSEFDLMQNFNDTPVDYDYHLEIFEDLCQEVKKQPNLIKEDNPSPIKLSSEYIF